MSKKTIIGSIKKIVFGGKRYPAIMNDKQIIKFNSGGELHLSRDAKNDDLKVCEILGFLDKAYALSNNESKEYLDAIYRILSSRKTNEK